MFFSWRSRVVRTLAAALLLSSAAVTPVSAAADCGVEILVVLDASGSLAGDRAPSLRAELAKLLAQGLQTRQSVNPCLGAIMFGGGAPNAIGTVPMRRLTGDDVTRQVVGEIERGVVVDRGGTDYLAALAAAEQALRAEPASRAAFIVFLSDGAPAAGQERQVGEATARLLRDDAKRMLFTIGLLGAARGDAPGGQLLRGMVPNDRGAFFEAPHLTSLPIIANRILAFIVEGSEETSVSRQTTVTVPSGSASLSVTISPETLGRGWSATITAPNGQSMTLRAVEGERAGSVQSQRIEQPDPGEWKIETSSTGPVQVQTVIIPAATPGSAAPAAPPPFRSSPVPSPVAAVAAPSSPAAVSTRAVPSTVASPTAGPVAVAATPVAPPVSIGVPVATAVPTSDSSGQPGSMAIPEETTRDASSFWLWLVYGGFSLGGLLLLVLALWRRLHRPKVEGLFVVGEPPRLRYLGGTLRHGKLDAGKVDPVLGGARLEQRSDHLVICASSETPGIRVNGQPLTRAASIPLLDGSTIEHADSGTSLRYYTSREAYLRAQGKTRVHARSAGARPPRVPTLRG